MAAWSLRTLNDVGAGVRTLPSARPGVNARAQPRRIRLWTRTVRTARICQLSGISRIRTARGTAPTTTSSMRDALLLALFFRGRNTPGRRQDLSKTPDLRRLHEPQRAMCGGARLVVDQRVGAEFGAPLREGPGGGAILRHVTAPERVIEKHRAEPARAAGDRSKERAADHQTERAKVRREYRRMDDLPGHRVRARGRGEGPRHPVWKRRGVLRLRRGDGVPDLLKGSRWHHGYDRGQQDEDGDGRRRGAAQPRNQTGEGPPLPPRKLSGDEDPERSGQRRAEREQGRREENEHGGDAAENAQREVGPPTFLRHRRNALSIGTSAILPCGAAPASSGPLLNSKRTSV